MTTSEGSIRRGEKLLVAAILRFTRLNPRNCHRIGGELLAKVISSIRLSRNPMPSSPYKI